MAAAIFVYRYLQMFLEQYSRSASVIIQTYNGEMPLAAWLKNYFKANKKFGSKDRKAITSLCFCYYRIGKAWSDKSVQERLLIAQFLCDNDSVFIEELKPDWKAYNALPLQDKLAFLGSSAQAFFPFSDELSDEIDASLFDLSFLVQPDLFLRIRPGKKEDVIKKLEGSGIPFSIEDDCLRLHNTTKADALLEPDKEVVVQDKSSQQVLASLIKQGALHLKNSWDCCAASGGKSILLHDKFPEVPLTVSDIRESILHNLRNRFKKAGIQRYNAFVADVSSPQFTSPTKYDLVLCDAPCSGSGTWGRTPEQLLFFKKDQINDYSRLQKTIAANAIKSLKKGGYFLYITCSVFKKENEEVVDHIMQTTSLRLLDQCYHKGYAQKADTLFTALFLLQLH